MAGNNGKERPSTTEGGENLLTQAIRVNNLMRKDAEELQRCANEIENRAVNLMRKVIDTGNLLCYLKQAEGMSTHKKEQNQCVEQT